jgi:predicted nucleotidyltransferase
MRFLIDERLPSTWFRLPARGDARPNSNVDLLIDPAPDAEPSPRTFSGLQLDLADALGRPVHLGERRALKPRVAEAADSEMVRVF